MKGGKKCGKLYNIEQCSGTCSQTDPNIPDHYEEWVKDSEDGGGGSGEYWVIDWSKTPCDCKTVESIYQGQPNENTQELCRKNICKFE